MSAIAPPFVVQIPTTGLQLGGLLSTYPEKWRNHKYCISKELWEGKEWSNVFDGLSAYSENLSQSLQGRDGR